MATDPGKFNRHIVLLKPPAKTADSYGEMVPVTNAQPTRLPVWASWKEVGGRETEIEEQEVGVTVVTVDFWWHVALRDIDVHWTLVGENQCEYDILSVEELGGRRVQIRLKVVLRN